MEDRGRSLSPEVSRAGESSRRRREERRSEQAVSFLRENQEGFFPWKPCENCISAYSVKRHLT